MRRFAPHQNRQSRFSQASPAAQAKDDQAIAEAFAQQAYTAVGNRDRKIMKDPYLLGFEIVDKNEDNNRLVGVFAFRVSGEILMVPVFYLNGQIKGHDLIYRKPVNRFYPNTEKWVSYFVGRGEDNQGHGVSRRSNADARIHLGIDRMSRMPGSYKSAAEQDDFSDILDDGQFVQAMKVASIEGLDKEANSKILMGLLKALRNPELRQLPGNSPVLRREISHMAGGAIPPNYALRLKTLENRLADPTTNILTNLGIGAGATGGFAAGMNADKITSSIGDAWNKLQEMVGYKSAAEDEAPIDIKAEWKEACDRSGFRPEHLDGFVFADMLVDQGMQKEAAELAQRLPWFADTIVLAGLLDKPLTKKAAAPNRSLEYHVEPPAGATEEEVAAHYQRGFSFVDKRAAESLATAVKALDESPISKSWSSLRRPGLNRAAGRDGSVVKVLWGPTTASRHDECCVTPVGYGPGRRGKTYTENRLVFLEGPDKGCVITYRHGCAESELPLFSEDSEVEKEAGWFGDVADAAKTLATSPSERELKNKAVLDHIGRAGQGIKDNVALFTGDMENAITDLNKSMDGEDLDVPPVDIKASMGQPDAQQFFANAEKKAAQEVPGSSAPKKGKAYVVWIPGLNSLFGSPLYVKSIETTGDVTKINFKDGTAYGETQCRLIHRKDLETTTWDSSGRITGTVITQPTSGGNSQTPTATPAAG